MSKNTKNQQNAAPSFPARVRGYNHYSADHNLHRMLDRYYPDMLARQGQMLDDYGAFAATKLDAQAEYSDRIAPPTLKRTLDAAHAPTERTGQVFLNPDYKECQQDMYRHGILAKCFERKEPEPHMLTFLAQYLTSYSDISTGCPLAMTHPNAIALATRAPKKVRDAYLPQFLRTDGKTMIGGTWATEWAGGSDVRGNTETEIDILDEKTGKCYVNGRQFFASAIGFDSWGIIKTVKHYNDDTGKEGIALVFIPSHLDDKWDDMPANREANHITVDHLKEKSGTRGLPTAETEMTDAIGYVIADETSGLRAMMEALGCSRVHNAMAAAGVMHRAYNEALFWTANRKTFGGDLITREDIQADLVKLKTEWMGGMALAFEAAKSFDDTIKDPKNAAWLRIATALAKYKTAEQATECTAIATEIVGGTGYTQDHPIERVNRDAMVLRVWEGPKNIQAREVVGMLAAGGAEAFLGRVKGIANGLPQEMTDARKKLDLLTAKASASFRKIKTQNGVSGTQSPALMDGLSEILTYALLCDEAAYEIDTHNDMTKLLVATDYFEAHKLDDIRLLPLPSRLQTQFHNFTAGAPINANTQGTKNTSAPQTKKSGPNP